MLKLKRVMGLIGVLGVIVIVAGCAQDNDQRQVQPSVQPQTTVTRQEAPAQGNTYVFVQNAPNSNGGGLPVKPVGSPDGEEDAIGQWVNAAASSNREGNTSGGQSATYAMSGTTVNVYPGGQSPVLTGTSTGGAMTQTPTQTGTQAPVQHIQPELTTAMPIAVGPNSSQNANAVGRGSGNANKQDQLYQTAIQALMDKTKAQELLIEELKKRPTGATPATPPTGTQPTEDGS